MQDSRACFFHRRTTQPAVLGPVKVEIFLDAEDCGIRKRGLVDVEKGIVDENQRQDNQIYLTHQGLLFFWVDGQIVRVGKKSQSNIAILLFRLGREFELLGRRLVRIDVRCATFVLDLVVHCAVLIKGLRFVEIVLICTDRARMGSMRSKTGCLA